MKASVASICSIGWKLLHSDEVHCINAWDFPRWKEDVNDDRPVLEAFLKVVEDADAIVTHHGKGFDEKFVETRLLLHGMDQMAVAKHVDTKQLVRKLFFIDNKLQTLGEELCGERKLEHEGWDLWVKTHGGSKKRVIDEKAQKLMSDYCKQDVLLLEKVFLRLRHRMKGANAIPNLNGFREHEKECCPRCGSTRRRKNGFFYSINGDRRQKWRCLDCSGISKTNARGQNPRAV